ncbi:MAG: glycosyl hydrolase, partial [Bacteroidales bacterium]|nr:glycosyl hydrolase [Bacteroidales bacterium]
MLHSFLIIILSTLFQYFSSPDNANRPFVRWWWNGDKVERNELIRELNLLHEAGIGGVEINPIAYPGTTDELNVRALDYLSDEWIDMLKVVFDEADRLGMTCDLIIGSGWPFGAEYLPREDRASVMLTYAEKLKGGTHYESSKYNLLCQSDPGVTIVNPRRSAEIVSILLAPDPISDISEVRDLSEFFKDKDIISFDVPEQGDWCLYVMSRFDSFASVIHGAPGASGSILNHMDREAVLRYLNHMADEIESRIGPLSGYLRSFFVDSMELEGCNWTKDFAEEFERRRGYDIMPWLPLIMFKVGRLGEVTDYRFGADKTEQFQEELNRVRFDFELTKAELLHERYTETFLA